MKSLHVYKINQRTGQLKHHSATHSDKVQPRLHIHYLGLKYR